jgi:4-hydroxybenzoate polyprenyltransferase
VSKRVKRRNDFAVRNWSRSRLQIHYDPVRTATAGSGLLELVRPPNVATALADVLAGYAIAGLGHPDRLAWLLAATAGLYGGGVVLNDYFDRALDAVERPERPIPSGRVRAGTAASFGAGLLLLGIAAATMATKQAAVVAVAIAALAVTYDAAGKHSRVLGPINMGACRGLNLLLGMAAGPAVLSSHWGIAVLPFAYIWAVTSVSRGEVHGGGRDAATGALFALAGVLGGLLWLSVQGAPDGRLAAWLLTAALAWRVMPAFWAARREGTPGTIRVAVRTGVLSLVLLDAVLGAVYAGTWYALLVLAAAFVAGWLARQFAVT